MLSMLLQFLWNRKSKLSLSISGLVMLLSASKGTTAIMDGLHVLMDNDSPQSFWKRRFHGMLCFLAIFCALAPITVLAFFQERLAQRLPQVQMLFSFVFFSGILSMLFYLLPYNRIRFRFCFLGGCFSSLGWIVSSRLFTLYVRWFSGSYQIYGGLGVFMMGGIWMYICISLLLYGGLLAVLCAYDAYHPLKIVIQTFRACS